MKTRVVQIVFFSFLFTSISNTYAQDIARTNLRYELPYIYAQKDIRSIYASHKKAEFKTLDKAEECSIGPSGYSCLKIRHGILYTYPYPTYNLFGYSEFSGIGTSIHSWAPISEVKAGTDSLTKWINKANNRSVFDCQGIKCKTYIFGIAGASTKFIDSNKIIKPKEDLFLSESKKDSILAVCNVLNIEGKLGAVNNCNDIAKITNDTTWVRIVGGILDYETLLNGKALLMKAQLKDKAPPVSEYKSSWLTQNLLSMENLAPYFQQFHQFSFKLYKKPLPKTSSIINTNIKILEEQPFKLNTKAFGNRINATTDLRYSNLLNKFEQATFFVFIDSLTVNFQPMVSVKFNVYINVSYQNTGVPKDLHVAQKNDFNIYEEAVKNKLKPSLEKYCDVPKWIDTYTLQCH